MLGVVFLKICNQIQVVGLIESQTREVIGAGVEKTPKLHI